MVLPILEDKKLPFEQLMNIFYITKARIEQGSKKATIESFVSNLQGIAQNIKNFYFLKL